MLAGAYYHAISLEIFLHSSDEMTYYAPSFWLASLQCFDFEISVQKMLGNSMVQLCRLEMAPLLNKYY